MREGAVIEPFDLPDLPEDRGEDLDDILNEHHSWVEERVVKTAKLINAAKGEVFPVLLALQGASTVIGPYMGAEPKDVVLGATEVSAALLLAIGGKAVLDWATKIDFRVTLDRYEIKERMKDYKQYLRHNITALTAFNWIKQKFYPWEKDGTIRTD